MRIFRIIVAIVTAFVIGISATLYIRSNLNDTKPVITCKVGQNDYIKASVKATDKQLISYVTAHDEQDGDLTKKVIVEKLTYFIEPGVTKIKYVVCDSDNNVTTLERKIRYTDYKSPQIKLTSDMIFTSGEKAELSGIPVAHDDLDGDITSNIKIISSSFTSVTSGQYDVNFKVNNSMGDVCDLTVKAIVAEKSYSDAQIKLSDYTVYLKRNGDVPDFASYVSDVKNADGKSYKVGNVVVDSKEVNIEKDGVYNVFYYIYDKKDVVTETRLVVVVGENY